ncbi:DnaB-like replicative helicase [Mycobacterium phage Kumao]|uniref:DNA 5'-3' helicase n=1 Tax=Mycobacterium phage Kumao TaxID=2041344 RepID=A0A2D1GPY7_9CAUD|nr:DnaB-like replicative helicase [Mycobacterium phage Kumao]ATN94028.1 DnaB-like dsDNA helicase [Mycobacterium phage Kumao]
MTEPQHDLQAEQSLLGAILQFPKVIPDVAQKVQASDLYLPKHELVFDAAMHLFNNGDPVDATTVAAELDRRKQLVKIGGAPFLFELISIPVVADAAPVYAGIVASKSRLRRIAELGTRLQSASNDMEADEAVAALHQFMDELEIEKECGAEGFQDVYEDWLEWQESPDVDPPIPTPWYEVNEELTGGYHRQRLYIVGARPGCGKSNWGLNSVLHAAMAGYSTMVFSLEMPKNEVMSRLLASGARVPLKDIIRRRMTGEDLAKVHRFMASTGNYKITINDDPGHTIETIMAACRAQKREGLDLVFIDYAQLLQASDPKAQRYQQVAWISKMAKIMARRLNVAVILACQLNRESEKEKRMPRMSDLRESGDLEADADAIVMLTRGDDEDDFGIIKACFVKNRTGTPDAVVPLEERFHIARLGA